MHEALVNFCHTLIGILLAANIFLRVILKV